MDTDFLEKYTALNQSFKKKLVFRLGADSGFFSEYNNMVLGVLYCLKHRIQFQLSSGFANFKYQDGWADFFEPFCTEDNRWLHDFYNYRPHMQKGRKQAYTAKFLKAFYGIDYLTQDLWNGFHERIFEKETFDIPTLGIQGGLLDAAQIIIKELLWTYNTSVAETISVLINQLMLPNQYIGIHIRAGDKFLEGEVLTPNLYIQKAESVTDCRNAFVLTDDYTVIESMQKDYPYWNIYTLCSVEERGFSNVSFVSSTTANKSEKLLNLFASMDIIAVSDIFIGTFNSNPGMYLGMRRGKNKSIGMDRKEWLIW